MDDRTKNSWTASAFPTRTATFCFHKLSVKLSMLYVDSTTEHIRETGSLRVSLFSKQAASVLISGCSLTLQALFFCLLFHQKVSLQKMYALKTSTLFLFFFFFERTRALYVVAHVYVQASASVSPQSTEAPRQNLKPDSVVTAWYG